MVKEILPKYIKTGALVNGKFHEFLLPTLLMSMSAQLGWYWTASWSAI